MKTTVVNLHKEPYDVYIGRFGKEKDGYFGNPFVMTEEAQRASSLRKYGEWFLRRVNGDEEFRKRIEGLKGKRLGCFCKPKACHGDIIAEYLNRDSLL